MQPGVSRLPRVVIRPEEVERDVRLIADHPTVVRRRGDVEQLARAHLDDRPIVERCCCRAGDYHPDVLDAAPRGPDGRPDVLGPPPPRLVGRTSDGEPADADDVEPPPLHVAGLVGRVEPLEDDADLGGAHGREAKVLQMANPLFSGSATGGVGRDHRRLHRSDQLPLPR